MAYDTNPFYILLDMLYDCSYYRLGYVLSPSDGSICFGSDEEKTVVELLMDIVEHGLDKHPFKAPNKEAVDTLIGFIEHVNDTYVANTKYEKQAKRLHPTVHRIEDLDEEIIAEIKAYEYYHESDHYAVNDYSEGWISLDSHDIVNEWIDKDWLKECIFPFSTYFAGTHFDIIDKITDVFYNLKTMKYVMDDFEELIFLTSKDAGMLKHFYDSYKTVKETLPKIIEHADASMDTRDSGYVSKSYNIQSLARFTEVKDVATRLAELFDMEVEELVTYIQLKHINI